MSSQILRLKRFIICAAALTFLGNALAARAWLDPLDPQDPQRPDSYDSSAPGQPPSPDATGPSKTASADRLLTRKVMDAIKADETLSETAHKIQVTAREGKVTLFGVVASVEERTVVLSKAKNIAGAGKVINRLKITTASR